MAAGRRRGSDRGQRIAPLFSSRSWPRLSRHPRWPSCSLATSARGIGELFCLPWAQPRSVDLHRVRAHAVAASGACAPLGTASGKGEGPLPGRRRAGRIVGASLTVNGVLGATIIVGAGAAAAIFRVEPSSAVLLLALVTYGALLASCSALEAVFRARRRLSRVVAATLLEKLLLLVLVAASSLRGLTCLWSASHTSLPASRASASTSSRSSAARMSCSLGPHLVRSGT